MSTPMRHGPSQQGRTPSQMQGAAPTPPVSTPFSNSQTQVAFSPHQGSRTSPQQFKKSPATSHTLKGLSDSTATMTFDSPSATAALGALGMNGNLDLNLDNLSMGTLGLGRADEDERKRRMDTLGLMLKAAGKGKVSNEGLERLARSIGLECLWEDNPAAGPLSKTLFIAGNGLALEIVITNHVVENVALTFPECTPSVQQNVGKAADILLRDLKLGPDQSPLTKTLENFQPNLEHLATLDRLSVLPTLNCYDALAGIYDSLLKIYNWDVAKLREEPTMQGKSEEFLQVAALCTRHGCPLLHVRDRIGLSLDYWKERRKLVSTTIESSNVKTWGILIECAPKNGMVVFPIRVSDKWISDDIEKTQNLTHEEMLSISGPILDWQEPENTFLPSEDETKVEPGVDPDPSAMSGGPKLPEVIFMATFDPPITVTTAVAAQIYGITGTHLPESSATFDGLVFPIAPGGIYDATEPRVITRLQPVSKFIPGTKEEILTHMNTLYVYKPVYGQVLHKVPIQHPRQLIAMLPMLRQFAFLSTLLSRSFKPKDGYPEIAEKETNPRSLTTAKDDFNSFMSDFDSSPNASGTTRSVQETLKVDITLTAHPVPRLQIVFPFKAREAHITLEIQLGGKVHIVSDNVFSDGDGDHEMGGTEGKGKGRGYSTEQWANMLELTEDIGIWCEYIKHKLG